jgi:hypothetical protein
MSTRTSPSWVAPWRPLRNDSKLQVGFVSAGIHGNAGFKEASYSHRAGLWVFLREMPCCSKLPTQGFEQHVRRAGVLIRRAPRAGAD